MPLPEDAAPAASESSLEHANPAQLEARLAEERRELAAATPAPEQADGAEEALEALTAAVAALELADGPPEESAVLELMAALEALAEVAGDTAGAAIAELAERVLALSEREPIQSAEQLAQLEQIGELDKARDAYERKVRKIVGPEAPLEVCATCEGLGFDLTGGPTGEELRTHADYIGCDDCAGLGVVLTGSKVAGSEVATCPGCGGRGFLSRIEREHANGGEPSSSTAEPEYGRPAWLGDPSLAAPA